MHKVYNSKHFQLPISIPVYFQKLSRPGFIFPLKFTKFQGAVGPLNMTWTGMDLHRSSKKVNRNQTKNQVYHCPIWWWIHQRWDAAPLLQRHQHPPQSLSHRKLWRLHWRLGWRTWWTLWRNNNQSFKISSNSVKDWNIFAYS